MRRNAILEAWLEQHLPFYLALSGPQRDRFFSHLNFRLYRAGEVLFRRGDEPRRLFLVRSGTVKVNHVNDSGREQILAMAFEGEMVGLAAVLAKTPHATTAAAVRKTVAGAVPAGTVHEVLGQNAAASQRLLQHMAARVRRAERQLVDVTQSDAKARVAGLLLAFAQEYGSPTEDGPLLDLGLTHEQLAGLVGMSRETVTRTLKAFRERGWIQMDRRGLVVTDRAGLEDCRGA